jgi:hypothetical protein
MLVVDPKQRVTMAEIKGHTWTNSGYAELPESYLPNRQPLNLPLRMDVVNKMTGFSFGPPDFIMAELTRILNSKSYKQATSRIGKIQTRSSTSTPPRETKKNAFSNFARLLGKAEEVPEQESHCLSSFSPYISIYYLVSEKMEREKVKDIT